MNQVRITVAVEEPPKSRYHGAEALVEREIVLPGWTIEKPVLRAAVTGLIDQLMGELLDDLRNRAADTYDPADGSPDPVPDLAAGDHFVGIPEPTAV